MYRFLATPRWLGYAGLTVLLAAVMIELGVWQLHRYQARSAVNARIDAAISAAPVPLTEVLAAPEGGAGSVAPPPTAGAVWTRVSVTGRYDQSHEILVRDRTLDGQVGFEIVTPLVLDGGAAVLVDRGWAAPAAGGATAEPAVPAAPSGDVTVIGLVHAPESRAGRVDRTGGHLQTRRIAPATAAGVLPYPLYGGYLTSQAQTPPADPGLVPIPPDHQNALLNAGYVVQWWLFAAMTVFGFGYLAYREAHGYPEDGPRRRTDRLGETEPLDETDRLGGTGPLDGVDRLAAGPR